MNELIYLYKDGRNININNFYELFKIIIRNKNNDINELFYTFNYNEYQSENVFELFLKNYNYLENEKIEELVKMFDLTVKNKEGKIKYNKQQNEKKVTKEQFAKLIDNKEIEILNEVENYLVYSLFDVQVVHSDKFLIIYNEIKKYINLDKEIILKSNFFKNAIFNENYDVLDIVMEDLNVDINTFTKDNPIYFEAQHKNNVDYISKKYDLDLNLKNTDNLTYIETLSLKQNGLSLINILNKNQDINKEELLIDYLINNKNLSDIKSIIKKIAKEKQVKDFDLKINNSSLLQLAITYKNEKVLMSLLNNKNFENLSKENYDLNGKKTNLLIEYLMLEKDNKKFSDYNNRKRTDILLTLSNSLNKEAVLSSEELKRSLLLSFIFTYQGSYNYNKLETEIKNLYNYYKDKLIINDKYKLTDEFYLSLQKEFIDNKENSNLNIDYLKNFVMLFNNEEKIYFSKKIFGILDNKYPISYAKRKIIKELIKFNIDLNNEVDNEELNKYKIIINLYFDEYEKIEKEKLETILLKKNIDSNISNKKQLTSQIKVNKL